MTSHSKEIEEIKKVFPGSRVEYSHLESGFVEDGTEDCFVSLKCGCGHQNNLAIYEPEKGIEFSCKNPNCAERFHFGVTKKGIDEFKGINKKPIRQVRVIRTKSGKVKYLPIYANITK